MEQVLEGRIDPSPALEMSVDLEGVPEGYAAMDSRQKIKVIYSESGQLSLKDVEEF